MKRILCLVLTVILTCTLFASCKNKKNSQNGEIAYEANLYFSNEEYNDIFLEKRNVSYGKDEMLAQVVLNELIKGPTDQAAKSVIPDGTKLISISIEGINVHIDLSKEFMNYSGENEKSKRALARCTIVKTLCEIPGIDRVEILVEGSPLVDSYGNPFGLISENDINVSNDENATYKQVVLYFADDMGEKLVAEKRRAQLVDNSLEKTILKELISGPSGDNCYATIPGGVQVVSVETKEGICFVNFSKEFANNIGGGSSASTMAIYSVVNSLSELDEIDKVQFLIDGEKTEWLGEYDVSEPFERDESFIKD